MNAAECCEFRSSHAQLVEFFDSVAWGDVRACLNHSLELIRTELEDLELSQLQTMALRGEAKAVRELMDYQHKLLVAAEQAEANTASDNDNQEVEDE